ncbi:hypothetical protein V5J96_001281 [Enterobacter cloacae]
MKTYFIHPMAFGSTQDPGHGHVPVVKAEDVERLRAKLEAAEKRIAEMQALASGVKQFSEFQICHYGATEDYAKGYIDCQNNYNKVLFAAAGKGDAS